ncbi:MAG: integrase domain-containing protein [Candidatus Tectomicrobia bacterium]|nr:integrase domain-containing protein [Candidatus Tectomicrobia bacterium]
MGLEHDFIQLCKSRDGKSHAAVTDRLRIARQMARDLIGPLRFPKTLRVSDLGGRHVNKLVTHWQRQEMSIGTIKNRLSVARYIYKRLGKSHMLLRTNGEYGIGERPRRTVSRAIELTEEALARIDSKQAPRIRVSLRLQRYLGLRFEESVKLIPREAIVRDMQGTITGLRLRGSWCKNGRERNLVIEKEHQRELLEECVVIAGAGSLINPFHTYDKWRNHFYYYCGKAGIRDRHGLRHQYAQERYTELTGHQAPILDIGGSEEVELDWVTDDRARHHLSNELGHGRKKVTDAYLGKSTNLATQKPVMS